MNHLITSIYIVDYFSEHLPHPSFLLFSFLFWTKNMYKHHGDKK